MAAWLAVRVWVRFDSPAGDGQAGAKEIASRSSLRNVQYSILLYDLFGMISEVPCSPLIVARAKVFNSMVAWFWSLPDCKDWPGPAARYRGKCFLYASKS
jgi:hypothetical protein